MPVDLGQSFSSCEARKYIFMQGNIECKMEFLEMAIVLSSWREKSEEGPLSQVGSGWPHSGLPLLVRIGAWRRNDNTVRDLWPCTTAGQVHSVAHKAEQAVCIESLSSSPLESIGVCLP